MWYVLVVPVFSAIQKSSAYFNLKKQINAISKDNLWER